MFYVTWRYGYYISYVIEHHKKIFNSPEFLSVKYCRKGEVLVC